MYLRYTIRKKDGKVHRYCCLVRSVRVGRRVIQQTVAQLGDDDLAFFTTWCPAGTVIETLVGVEGHVAHLHHDGGDPPSCQSAAAKKPQRRTTARTKASQLHR